MSAIEGFVAPCARVVPGHHPAFDQIANAPRSAHRVVEGLWLEGEHTVHLTLDDGGAVIARNHETANIAKAWRRRIGVVTWNATARLLAIAIRFPEEGHFFFHLTEGPFTPCDELEGSAVADLSFTFEELVAGPLADLRDVRPESVGAVPPEPEKSAGTPDEPLTTLGAPMHVRFPDGSRLARAAFFMPDDPRHSYRLAGIITSDDQLYYLGPDVTRAGIHTASPTFPPKGEYCRMVYFGPSEFVLDSDRSTRRSLSTGLEPGLDRPAGR